MRVLTASFGSAKHNARVTKTWRGTFEEFVRILLSRVPETMDKASNGWVCGSEFLESYRHSRNFVARHFLSFDYDHNVTEEDQTRILAQFEGFAHLAYTTYSHMQTCDKEDLEVCSLAGKVHPRFRVWLPLSRPTGSDEFQAVSRRIAEVAGIEFAARESHTLAQYMFRPSVKPFDEIRVWKNLTFPWVDVDEVLKSYDNFTDRTSWPHRAKNDNPRSDGAAELPESKPGAIGAMCRRISVTEAIERFELPYKPGSQEDRWTYIGGTRPDGLAIYDRDTKAHSRHDSDPARGQSNAFDLIRIHHFGKLDTAEDALKPMGERPSYKAMVEFAQTLPEVRAELIKAEGFTDLDAVEDTSWDERPAPPKPPASVAPALPDRIRKPKSRFTDLANARRIQIAHGTRLLSVGKQFYRWSGTHWEEEGGEQQAGKYVADLSLIVDQEAQKEAERIREKAKEAERDLTQEELDYLEHYQRWVTACEMVPKMKACSSILLDHLDFPARNFNRDPDLFNCVNGTVNLRTGELKPHDYKDFLTGCAPTPYDPGAQCPRFEKFMLEIFEGNADMVGFLQRWFGYCLTGTVREHRLVFHIGPGGNGKGTLMGLMSHILGSNYYTEAGRTLLERPKQGATPELADLLGRRMVTISETDEDETFNGKTLKYLTGGDPIKARLLHRNLIEFEPTHKLQIFTNSKPRLPDTSFGVRRRVLLVDYRVQYGDKHELKKDKTGQMKLKDIYLDAALDQERPGILRWVLDGAREWYTRTLDPPECVRLATDEYLDGEDTTALFVRERLTIDPSARAALTGAVGAILPAYRAWCDTMGFHPMGRIRFQKQMERLIPQAPFTNWKEGGGVVHGWIGIKLTDGVLDD